MVGKDAWYDFNFFKFTKACFVAQHVRDLSCRTFHVHLKGMCTLLLDGMLYKYQLDPSGLMCHLKLVFPYWLCLDDLSIAVSGLLKVLFLCYCRFLLYGWWDFSDILGCFYVGCIYICCCSVAKSCPTLYNPMTITHQAPLSFTISWSLRKFMSIESVMLSNHLTLCCPLLLLPSILPSHQCLFQWVGSLQQVAKVLELQL